MASLFKDQQAAFSLALELANKSLPYQTIANELNAKGYKNTHGKPWDKHTVSRMMVSNNVRRKKPRAKVQPIAPMNQIHHTVSADRVRSVKAILLIDSMPLQLRVDTVLTLLEGVQ
jgi:hypothetical protein